MATRTGAFTTSELMVVAGARELREGELAFVGLGIPQVAAALAQRTHARGLVVLNEIGLADPRPVEFGVGNADPRHWYGASVMGGFVDVMGKLLHRGLVDVGFLGALEVDAYGNANATEVRREDGSIRRFGGGGGANDIASLARSTILIIRHERRKLVEKVAHLTDPGRGVRSVLTDKCVFGVDPSTRRLVVRSVHPGIGRDELRDATGFALDIPERVPTTEAPTAEELRLIREVIDPERLYTKAF
ncbi:MAG: 3-oxoadipate--succinyl-CoA transferase subunit B [Chloroflexota bacterium]|nr:3-oxoadipate--succinyl-CoA transferase subunit B [Chloroflexota bacterium]MDE3193187.1 3-oxoadipate--succinyl-CoA transferase subunit B [Chloroflexota bacterium]